MVASYRRKGTYSLWAEDVTKSAVKIVVRGSVSIRPASGLFKIPSTMLAYDKNARMKHLEESRAQGLVTQEFSLTQKKRTWLEEVLVTLRIRFVGKHSSLLKTEL
jgi:hypothetical protein